MANPGFLSHSNARNSVTITNVGLYVAERRKNKSFSAQASRADADAVYLPGGWPIRWPIGRVYWR